MPIGDLYRLVMTGDYNEQVLCENVFHLRARGALVDAGALLDSWLIYAWPTWRTHVIPVYRLRLLSVRRILPYASELHQVAVDQRGMWEAYELMPAVVAGVISWRTGTRGAHGRGRTFIAGLNYETLDGLYWTDLGLTHLAAIRDAILDGYGPAGGDLWELGVWSPTLGGRVPPLDPAGFTPITNGALRRELCTMGSRRAGHGY